MIRIPGSIPIQIYPIFWLLIIMIGWLNTNTIPGTLVWSVVIFLSILIHEFGHALTAKLFGQKAEINLVGLGGLTKHDGPNLKKWQQFLIVLNGPIAGFFLCFLSYYFLNHFSNEMSTLARFSLNIAFNVNLFWTILNLAPVLPLDGGHLLRIVLEGIFGLRGQKIALFISVVIGALLGVFFLLEHQIFAAAIFIMMAFESFSAWSEIKSMTSSDSDGALQELLKIGLSDISAGRLDEAFEKFTYIREQAPKGILYVNATQAAARILVEQGNLKKAYDWLYPLQNRLSTDYLQLLQQLAYQLQEWEQAIKIGQTLYQSNPSYETALINALSYAIIGQSEPSVGWLRAMSLYDFKGMKQIAEKREFDSIRSTEVFQSWYHSILK